MFKNNFYIPLLPLTSAMIQVTNLRVHIETLFLPAIREMYRLGESMCGRCSAQNYNARKDFQ